jgi:ribose-phosphate pyrophosphokinase
LAEATKVLKEKGALSVSCFATHGLFTGKAIENIKKSQLDQVIVTNTIPPKENEETLTDGRIIRLSVAPILAEAIFRIQTRTSISSLFSIPKT